MLEKITEEKPEEFPENKPKIQFENIDNIETFRP